MLGVLANSLAIVLGSVVGLLAKKLIPERLTDLVMKGMALCVIYIGIDGAFSGTNTLITVISMAVGAVIGGLLDLDAKLERGAKKIEDKLVKDENKGGFAEAFTTSTCLFCVGAMAIVGSLQAGLQGDNSTLFTKAVIDGVGSVVFAATLGYGVIFSSIPILIYQGAMVLIAAFVAPYLTDYCIAEMSCAGSLLIVGLGLNMLGASKIKIMNLMPAMFIPIILCLFM